jgi:hypothetical protein
VDCELIRTDANGRGLYFQSLWQLAEWPDQIEEPDPHFILFLACEATDLSTEEIADFALKMRDQGIACLCAWGPDSERVHDIFGEALVGASDPFEMEWEDLETDVVMTWHDDVALDEGLRFALHADPDERYAATCDAVLAVVVGNREWAENARRRLAKPVWIEATAEAAEFIRTHGGELYMWQQPFGRYWLLDRQSMKRPNETIAFVPHETDQGFTIFLDDRLAPPNELKVDLAPLPWKRLKLLWNGQPWGRRGSVARR